MRESSPTHPPLLRLPDPQVWGLGVDVFPPECQLPVDLAATFCVEVLNVKAGTCIRRRRPRLNCQNSAQAIRNICLTNRNNFSCPRHQRNLPNGNKLILFMLSFTGLQTSIRSSAFRFCSSRSNDVNHYFSSLGLRQDSSRYNTLFLVS